MFDVQRTDALVPSGARHPKRPSLRALGVVCLLFCITLVFTQVADGFWGGWTLRRSNFQSGAWWLPISAQWVHLNWLHALANMAVFCAVALVFAGQLSLRESAVLCAASMAAVALLLALDTACAYYAGSSGVLYGWLAGGGLVLAAGSASTHPDRGTRLLGTVCVLLPVLRAVWQLMSATDGQSSTVLGIVVYSQAHVAGIAGGLLGGILVVWRRRSTSAAGEPAEAA